MIAELWPEGQRASLTLCWQVDDGPSYVYVVEVVEESSGS